MKYVMTTTMSAAANGDEINQEQMPVEVEATDRNEVALHLAPGTDDAVSHYFTSTDAALIGMALIQGSQNAATWEGPQ